ncbi:hypothetical protein NW754_010599 [Fusarium falciforme]|nr:hypothetical protein NW754_010599 [Fusarium falciforme]
MQFTLASILALAAVVAAAPAPGLGLPILGGGEDGGRGAEVCSVENKQVCCNGLLNCAVQILGDSCKGGNAYCCNTGATPGTWINIALANCVDIL